MKTIEEEAKEFSNTKGTQSCKLMREVEYDTGRFVGFKAGIKFAQRWIPVEEELPENTFLIDEGWFSIIRFLVKGTNGKEWVAFRRKTEQVYQFESCETGRYFSVTHWRPIELK